MLLADDPEMPASVPAVKPARNLVRSGQQASGEEGGAPSNGTSVEAPGGRNSSRKRDERRKGAGRKNGNKKNGQTGKRSALPERNNSTAPTGRGKKISNKTSRINQDRTKAHNRRNKDKKRKKGNSVGSSKKFPAC